MIAADAAARGRDRGRGRDGKHRDRRPPGGKFHDQVASMEPDGGRPPARAGPDRRAGPGTAPAQDSSRASKPRQDKPRQEQAAGSRQAAKRPPHEKRERGSQRQHNEQAARSRGGGQERACPPSCSARAGQEARSAAETVSCALPRLSPKRCKTARIAVFFDISGLKTAILNAFYTAERANSVASRMQPDGDGVRVQSRPRAGFCQNSARADGRGRRCRRRRTISSCSTPMPPAKIPA